MNDAGQELLSFLSINDASVCNMWFMKKSIHKRTRQHPKSKQWHCIDYVIMKKAHCWRCVDAPVIRGAQCKGNHMMFRVKVQIGSKLYRSGCGREKARKVDVAKLLS